MGMAEKESPTFRNVPLPALATDQLLGRNNVPLSNIHKNQQIHNHQTIFVVSKVTHTRTSGLPEIQP